LLCLSDEIVRFLELAVTTVVVRDADAEREANRSVQERALREVREELLGDRDRYLDLGVFEHDGEDRAAVARDRVGSAEHISQPPAELLDHTVAGIPSEGLVDRPKVVGID